MTANSTKTLWRLDANAATFNDTHVKLSIDLKRPNSGVGNISLRGVPVTGCHPLQVSPEPPSTTDGETILDSYVRGRDLIATYAQTPQRTVQPTYLWRILAGHDDLAGIELMISMETSLLDSDPSLTALTVCQGEAHWVTEAGRATIITDDTWYSPTLTSGFFLFRLANGISYAEMVFPADFLGARVDSIDGARHLTYRMFPEDLEKGVIRRGRIRALFLPTQSDIANVWDAYTELCAEEPPLTT